MGSTTPAASASACPRPNSHPQRPNQGHLNPQFLDQEAAVMAPMAGVEDVFVDMEHSALNFQAVAQVILASLSVGILPIVRAPPESEQGVRDNQPLLGVRNVQTNVQIEVLIRATMLIPMIKSPTAVKWVDEFLAIGGMDGILIASNDLCTDLGLPGNYDNPVYQQAVEMIVLADKKVAKPIGIGGIGGGRLDLLDSGCHGHYMVTPWRR
ncbi:Pyruvate/Phosphoenolpyruvate kinase-like domain-containing protein [Aspergillus navahoensis]